MSQNEKPTDEDCIFDASQIGEIDPQEFEDCLDFAVTKFPEAFVNVSVDDEEAEKFPELAFLQSRIGATEGNQRT